MLHKWAVSTINSIDHNILGKQYVNKVLSRLSQRSVLIFQVAESVIVRCAPNSAYSASTQYLFPRAYSASRHKNTANASRWYNIAPWSRNKSVFFQYSKPVLAHFFTFLGGYMQNICLKISEIMLHIAFNTKYKRQFQRVTRFEIMLYFR